MHQAALAPARRLWFRIWIALGMPAVPMAMHGAVRQCDGLPAGDRTYRHKRRVAVPALLMSGGWHGRPRARGVVLVAICMAFGTAARGRRRRSWWRTPACAPRYACARGRVRDSGAPPPLSLWAWAAALHRSTIASTHTPPARWPGGWLLKIVPFAIAAAAAPRLKLKPPALVCRAMLAYKQACALQLPPRPELERHA